MILPSFNYREFVAHVKRGPGFGCWEEGRVRKAWGRRSLTKRITAIDVARRAQRLAVRTCATKPDGYYHMGCDELEFLCRIAHSMLSKEAWRRVWDCSGALAHAGAIMGTRANGAWYNVRDAVTIPFIARGLK